MGSRAAPAHFLRRLGRNLLRLRTAAGLTQEQAAERAGLHVRFWQKCEHGEANPSLESLLKLANAFDTTPAALLEPPPRGR